MNYYSNSKKQFFIFMLSILAFSFSATSHSLQLSFATPPTLESAAFVLGQKNANQALTPITITSECNKCPTTLNLTGTSSIEQQSTNTFLAPKDLLNGFQYQSVYISYDPATLNIFSILLK